MSTPPWLYSSQVYVEVDLIGGQRTQDRQHIRDRPPTQIGGARIGGTRQHLRGRRQRPGHAARAVPDVLRRSFTASGPDRAWAGGITYLPVADREFLYLATVIDASPVCSPARLLGCSMADHTRAEPVTDAPDAAVHTRGAQVDGVIFHSGHGAPYGSKAFTDTCRQAATRRSMEAVGTCADNTAAESFFASLKREILPDGRGRPWPAEPTSRSARRLPPARLLQPPAPALHDRLSHAGPLRTQINSPGHRCMTTGVHDQGGSPAAWTSGWVHPARTRRRSPPTP
ncbi:hypothetical protein GCM10010388_74700 [Streptomyces mauvecolor]